MHEAGVVYRAPGEIGVQQVVSTERAARVLPGEQPQRVPVDARCVTSAPLRPVPTWAGSSGDGGPMTPVPRDVLLTQVRDAAGWFPGRAAPA